MQQSHSQMLYLQGSGEAGRGGGQGSSVGKGEISYIKPCMYIEDLGMRLGREHNVCSGILTAVLFT